MRIRGVSVAALLLLASLVHQGTGVEDIYWEGEDGANEFLEVKPESPSLSEQLKRLKRSDFFNFWGTTSTEAPDNYESITEDDDSLVDSKYDDSDTDGSGQPEYRIEPEPREKTLRVTFVVMEPYKNEYSNRDSSQFQNFSKSLADAVNALFESLPGTQKASLVRIQSRLSDEFTCKVTLDIVTTGYEDTDRITETLRDHIRKRSVLGAATVTDMDFSAHVIDPGSTLVTCASDELQCDDGSCIISSARCNGYSDCPDGSDEAGCSTDDANQSEVDDTNYGNPNCSYPLQCSNSPLTYCENQVCDGREDCPDGDDEANCGLAEAEPEVQRGDQSLEGVHNQNPVEESTTAKSSEDCHPEDIRCDETRCLPRSKICDGFSDCDDGTDERGCDKSCGNGDFRCDNNKCIDISRRCDRVVDCPGEEDEENCECTAEEFKCVSDGSCIELRKRCDGTNNCKDGSDEEECVSTYFDWSGHHVCKDRGMFRCGDGKCVSILLRCDGFRDCPKDGSDEIGCPCSSDQWQCDHGSCIKRTMRCDGRVDCPTDRSDERNCYATGYFKCRTGKLIPDSLRCNRRYDCPGGDYSDEQNCPCDEGDFKCDNGHCIPASKHCDRTHDCQDGSDERHCTYGTVCMAYQFKCTSGKCVQAESWCNGTAECDDASDEINCPCKRGQFQCHDGSCINIALRCNGHKDCQPAGEDEFNCGAPRCPPDSFACYASSSVPCGTRCNGVPECDTGEDEGGCSGCNHECDGKCLDDQLICNSVLDCSDGSDELNCANCDGPDDFRCDTGECLNAAQHCNGIPECINGSDEINCNETIIPTPGGCSRTEFPCRDGSCIDYQFFCDGNRDCNDGSDEENCQVCGGAEFRCRDNSCIDDRYVCDGNKDCSDGSDEDNCPCYSNQWQCRSGACIPKEAYCDGHYDCEDNSDENNCGFLPATTLAGPSVISTTSPSIYTTTQRDYPPYYDNRPGGDPNRPGYPGRPQERPSYPDGDYGTRTSRPGQYDGPTQNPDLWNGDNKIGGEGNGQPKYDSDGNTLNGNEPSGWPQQGGNGDNPSINEVTPYSTERPSYGDDGDDGPIRGDGGRQEGSDDGEGKDQTGNEYPGSDGNGQPSSLYPGGQSGSRYPDGNGLTGNGIPGSDGNRPTNEYPGSDENSQYAGVYPGGDTGDQSGNNYPNGDGNDVNVGAYPRGDGSDQSGGAYPDGGESDQSGGGYPGGDRGDQSGTEYPGGDGGDQSGSGYPGGNRGDQSGNGYPGSDGSGSSGSAGGGRPGSGYGSDGRGQVGNGYITGNSNEIYTPSPTSPTANRGGGCGRYQWRCENGPCIDYRRRCDGRFDCPYDSSDELDCPTGPSDLKLRTVPAEQTVRYSGDAVFQCRDEGPLRVPVRWVREGGRQLKPGSLDRKGRLELFKVTPSDDGVYICQAVRFTGYPGSEVRVILHVEAQPSFIPRPFTPCKKNEATCGNGQCIPKSATCDGKIDCSDGSDEDSCYQNGSCEPNQFQCKNNKCVLKTWWCDSEDDCGDGSDEADCRPKSPSDACQSVEFACSSGNQCVPKSFHCDGQPDCMDNSDEIGCAPVYVTQPPNPPYITLPVGGTLTLTCVAVGVPTPLISWRLNWGHVPPQCVAISENGTGTLSCPDMQHVHSGAYSCEAINNKGTTFATPDSLVFVNSSDPCPPSYFNSEARSESECIRCFCFGKSQQCHSADLFLYNMPTPLGQGGTRLVGVSQSPSGDVHTDRPISNQYYYEPLRNGATATQIMSGWAGGDDHPYVTLPESYNGKQLTSYGGHIKFVVTPHVYVFTPDDTVPSIIIKGKYGNLFHYYRGPVSREIVVEARLTPENWQKPSPRGIVQASREDIMMVLDHIEMILLRADFNNAGVNITDFTMESAQSANVGLGAASLVEECSCPRGYDGLSCEKCAFGFTRTKSGQWLGDCVPELCPPGTYGDPGSGVPCTPCPCPLTNPGNQFASTCSLGPRGNVVCDCHPGYEGDNCVHCAPGYVGNPLIIGDSCKPKPTDNCNPIGTQRVRLPDECICKENVQGRYCDTCKNDSFFLSEDFRHGCALCFCSGVSQNCTSSHLRRKTVTTQFNMPQVLSSVKIYKSSLAGPSGSVRYTAPIESDESPQTLASSYDQSPTVYYWSLPSSFAGDKVTSYGGYLRYTLENVPEFSTRTRNNAADVQLISDNHLTFHFVGNFTPTPNGDMDVTVKMVEKEWQRSDGKEISREHFLLALADVKTLLIKVRYSDSAPLAYPVSATIDIAEASGNGPLAYEVEQCVCPVGYLGTSCEDCAPGYTRSSSGLYLKHCRPCECNGRSNMCNPETGVCYSCSDNAAGAHCELCKPGYERDPYGNCVESYPIVTTSMPCRCDPSGTEAGCDASGVCMCKQNVEGENCDRCKPGTFGLHEQNALGCLSCYCSGVTSECHEGSHYTSTPIAAPILGEHYGGYTLMDINANQVINDNFVPVPNQSELTYVFSFPPNQELYWSLPVFPGNRVLSYGGTLSLRQSFYSTDNRTSSEPGVDVVLAGTDTSLYWTNPTRYNAGRSLTYQVPLTESSWYVLGTTSPANRHTFMRVLSNLRRVLVRATVAPNVLYAAIADVSMDTAVQNFDSSFPVANGVEVCMCPAGYSGTSCESCAPMHYKDRSGYCMPCPCNGHECQLDAYGQVSCNCRPPYTGNDCSALGLVMELHPIINDDGMNRTRFKKVTLTCKYRAPEPLIIKFYHEGHEQWPPMFINQSTLHKDGWHGEHVWHTVWDTNKQGEIYECHTVTQNGFTLGVLTTSLPEPVGAPQSTPSPRPPVPQPTVVVTVTSPTIKIQEVGSSVNFTCEASSRMTQNRLRIRWSKVAGYLPLGRSTVDELAGLLLITNLQISDSGQYVCETNDGVSTAQAIATLKVPGSDMTMPVVEIRPAVNDYYVGDRIELECIASGMPAPSISWQRASGRPLPLVQHNEQRFTIESAREEDSGEYRCIASNTLGSVDRTAIISIRPRPSRPPREKLTISPTSLTLPEGQSSRVVCTGTQRIPAGSIDWIRQDGYPLADNVRSENGVLYIEYARLDNQGVYLCQSSSPGVNAAQIVVRVEPQGTPSPDQMSNITVSVDRISIPTGESGTVECNPYGYPQPLIRWTKHASQFGPSTSQRGNTLIIGNAREDDRGYYLCEGIVDGRPIASVYVFVDIEKREAPRVEIWPQGDQSVPIGSQFEFHCRTTGGVPEPALTWSRGGSNRALSPHTHIRPNNLVFDFVDVNDEGEYTCSATNVAGSASASAVLKVRSPPEITITPSNQLEVKVGEPAVFECRANGYPEPMVSIKTARDMMEIVRPMPGIAVLRISSASERDEDTYICTATSPAGTTQEHFTLVVERGDGGDNDFPSSGDYDPSYQQPENQPSDLVALEGQREVTIICNVTGGLEARWSRGDGQPLQRNAIERGSSLIIYNVSSADSGSYVCSLQDYRGEVLQAVYTSLVVIGAPKITLRPKAQTVRPGQSPTVECVVENDDIIDIVWKPYNRAPSNRVEIRGSTLIFHQIEVEDAGKYECFARNRYTNSSAIAEVIVSEETDRAPSQSHDNEQYAHSGAAVHLSCNVTQRNVRIKWTKDGRPVARSQQKSDGSLFIKLAQKSDSGRYVCHIRDQYGGRTSNYINLHIEGIECLDTEFRCYDSSGCIDEALLCDDFQDCYDNSDEETCLYRHPRYSDPMWNNIDQFIPVSGSRDEGPASLVAIDQPRRRFRVSENVQVLCRSNRINVKWERYGTNQFVDSRPYGDGAVLVIQGVQESDAGVYRCVGTGPYANQYDDFNLEVEPSTNEPAYPDRDSPISEYTAQLRDSVDLPCRHNLDGPVVIEWKREFTPLPSEIRANQPNLHLERVTETDAGIYVCRVTNRLTTVESRAILRVEGLVPRFDGASWLSLPALKDPYRQFDIEITFRPADGDGLILYNSQNAGRSGDYVALSLVEGVPRFVLEAGNGLIAVEGDRPLQLNVWHTIRVSRTNSKLTMDIDNNGPFVAESSEHWTVLELSQPMYIGGVPNYDQLPAELAGSSGFVGCVSMLIFGREEQNIMLDALELSRVTGCNSCTPNQCQNNGVCQEALNERGYMCICSPGFAGANCDRTGEACRQGLCGPGKCIDSVDGYKCACPIAYTGKNCEVRQSIEYPAFTGSAYLAIKPPTTSRLLKMSMKVKPTLPVSDGIIMYCAQSSRGYGGFTSLVVRNGKLEFRYDLGGGKGLGSNPVVLTSNRTLPANEWTDLQISRLAGSVSLIVNLDVYKQELDRPSESLNLETPMFVGGVDDSIVLNNNTGVSGGFSGCIKDVMIYGTAVDIVNSSIQSANVRECSNFERGDIPDTDLGCQCYNGGTCPIDSTTCVCPIGFTGRQCETRVAAPLVSSHRPPSDPCSVRPCRNGGTCRPNLSNRMNHTCDCPLGFAGASCQIRLELFQSVGFNGNGYVELPANLLRYDELYREPAVIALAIHTYNDGVLLYQRELATPLGSGDYIMLRITEGFVELEWDLGGGQANILVDSVTVNDGERHGIIVKLYEDNHVSLSVDNNERTGTSTGLSNLMNADSNIYIGGIPDSLNLQFNYPGLTGCIEQVEFTNTGRGINIAQVAVAGRNAQRCREFIPGRI